MTRSRAAWAGLVVVALGLLGTPVPAAAAPPLMAIQNAMTGRCLASYGSTIYTTSSCRGRAALWYTVPTGQAYAVTSYASGLRLRINATGRGVDQWYSVFNGRYDVIRNYGTGLVLESDFAGDVHARPADGGLFQQWHWIVQRRPR